MEFRWDPGIEKLQVSMIYYRLSIGSNSAGNMDSNGFSRLKIKIIFPLTKLQLSLADEKQSYEASVVFTLLTYYRL